MESHGKEGSGGRMSSWGGRVGEEEGRILMSGGEWSRGQGRGEGTCGGGEEGRGQYCCEAG